MEIAVRGADKIAELNDAFRQRGFGILMTTGIREEIRDLSGLLKAVRFFNDFGEGNDPHREHDFGMLKWERKTVYWKIDYYDKDFKYWSDPESSQCNRVMTVMLSDEY